jgi:hypothetical protein
LREGPEALNLEMDLDKIPLIKKDKIMLKRLEIRSTKSKIGVTDLTWVNEEVKDIEKEDEKSLVVNEIALMIPYLNRSPSLFDTHLKPVRSLFEYYSVSIRFISKLFFLSAIRSVWISIYILIIFYSIPTHVRHN